MPVTPEGPISLRLEAVRTLLSNCPSWQAWTGKPTAAAAKRHVHLVDVPRPVDPEAGYSPSELAGLRPTCVVDEFQLAKRAAGFVIERLALGTAHVSGVVVLSLTDSVPEEDADDAVAAKLKFMNNVGQVVQDLMDLGDGEGDYLSVHKIEKYDEYLRSDETEDETVGDTFFVQFLLHHGI